MKDVCYEVVCLNLDEGRLVFEPPGTLNEIEREMADLHFGDCPACQFDLDLDYLIDKIEQEEI